VFVYRRGRSQATSYTTNITCHSIGNHHTRFTLEYGMVPTTSESCEAPIVLV